MGRITKNIKNMANNPIPGILGDNPEIPEPVVRKLRKKEQQIFPSKKLPKGNTLVRGKRTQNK